MTSIVPRSDIRQLLAETSQDYHEALMLGADDTVLEYLTKRGFERSDLERFKVGVVADPPAIHENYEGRISFPYLTRAGVVTIRFRRRPDRELGQKFLSISGDVARIYNVLALTKPNLGRVFICEGETDTIMASKAGLDAVGIPGVTNWNDKVWSRIFRDIDVCVLADNDDAGEGMKMAEKIYASLGGCDIIRMDEGHDVSSYVNEYGIVALREKVGADDVD